MKGIMGIDLGTTGCKASLFDQYGSLIVQSYREYPVKGYDGSIEGDMVWKSTQEVIMECTTSADDFKVEAICITSFGESVVLLDKEMQVLEKSILYSAGGVDEEWREFSQRLDPDQIYKITGHISHPIYTINRLMWYKKKFPELFSRIHKFMFFSSFIAWKLGAACIAENTQAARSMAYDVQKGEWCQEIIETAEIRKEIFPPIVCAGDVIGNVSDEMQKKLKLNGAPLIIAGGHDQPCVALGFGAVHKGDAVYGLGTVECLSVVLGDYQNSEVMKRSHLVCSPHVIPKKFLTYGVLYSGGNVIKTLRDKIFLREINGTDKSVYERMFENIDTIQNHLMVVPHLFGAGTPSMQQKEGASIIGLRAETTPEEILQATLEGLTFDCLHNIENMRKSNIAVDHICAAGGGAKSQQALQLRANILHQKLYVTDDVEAGARGVFFIAAKALGWIEDYEGIVQYMKKRETHIAPQKEKAAYYNQKYEQYSKIEETCRTWSEVIRGQEKR